MLHQKCQSLKKSVNDQSQGILPLPSVSTFESQVRLEKCNVNQSMFEEYTNRELSEMRATKIARFLPFICSKQE